jgi:phosphate-selective porin OprO/OprP
MEQGKIMSIKSIGVHSARAGFIGLLLSGASSLALAQAPDSPVATAQAAPSPAADPREARIEQLEAEVQLLADEVQDLKRNQASQIQTIAADEKRLPAPTSAIATIASGKPVIASPDGKFTAAFHGIMQFDAAQYDQPSPGPIASDFRRDGPAIGGTSSNVEAAHARNLKNGDVFRRARIGIDGNVYGDWDYRLVFDFAGSGVENAGQLYEAWGQYSGFKPFHLRVGAFSPSIGLDDQASTNGMPFLERAVSSDIARGLAAGDTRTAVSLWASGDRWLASGAFTGRTIGVINTGTASATAQTYGDQLGFVGRVAGTPFKGGDWLVHLGLHGSYVLRPANTGGPQTGLGGSTAINAQTIAFSNTPELRVDGTKLIDTGKLNARHADTIGAEFAVQKQNFLLQSEYEHFDVERTDVGKTNPSFWGYYVSGSWVLTGEARKYNTQTAAFDAPTVAHPFSLTNGGWGAWEVAVRYSDMNLNYKPGLAGTYQTGSSIRGGEEQNITAGVNWYLNPVLRLMFDYQHVKIDRLSPAANSSAASTIWFAPKGAQIGQTYDVFAVRSQVAF